MQAFEWTTAFFSVILSRLSMKLSKLCWRKHYDEQFCYAFVWISQRELNSIILNQFGLVFELKTIIYVHVSVIFTWIDLMTMSKDKSYTRKWKLWPSFFFLNFSKIGNQTNTHKLWHLFNFTQFIKNEKKKKTRKTTNFLSETIKFCCSTIKRHINEIGDTIAKKFLWFILFHFYVKICVN